MKRSIVTAILALMMIVAGTAAAHADILPPFGQGQIGLSAVVISEELTLYREASTSSDVLQTLHFGDLPIVTREDGEWARCVLGDAEDSPAGWVKAEGLLIDPAWYMIDAATPIYASRDAASEIVAMEDEFMLMPILAEEDGWILVAHLGTAGWICPEAPAAGTARQDGERFEAVISVEGMPETVLYEHAVNTAIGIEIDYEYETLERRSEPDRELFVSLYDAPDKPENYLEVTFAVQDADSVTAGIRAALSAEYDLVEEAFTLDGAGDCVRIDASCVKGTDTTPDTLQTVYVIPAPGGCVVAVAHCVAEAAEGFGTRFGYMMNSLVITGAQAE